MKFIHYGSTRFDPNKFIPIRNEKLMNKPYGGLWASPVDSTWGWRDWCKVEKFASCRKRNSFTFTLAPDARIHTINTYADIEALPRYQRYGVSYWFDFESMLNVYDAILLTEAGQQATRHTRPLSFYGWDCESILVLNKAVIVPEGK